MGDYAVRGGIIDIFPAGLDNPIRIEFFGDEIDSIREFEPLSQRSMRDMDRVELMARLFHADDADELTSTLLDHLGARPIVFLEEPERIMGLIEDAGADALAARLNASRRILHSNFPPSGTTDLIDAGARVQPSFHSSLG